MNPHTHTLWVDYLKPGKLRIRAYVYVHMYLAGTTAKPTVTQSRGATQSKHVCAPLHVNVRNAIAQEWLAFSSESRSGMGCRTGTTNSRLRCKYSVYSWSALQLEQRTNATTAANALKDSVRLWCSKGSLSEMRHKSLSKSSSKLCIPRHSQSQCSAQSQIWQKWGKTPPIRQSKRLIINLKHRK